MASYTRKEKDKALAQSRAKVVQAVFSAAESMGFSDREKLEELAAQVIRRLEGTQPLPGLEGLVATVKVSPSHSPNPAQIRSLVRDALSPPAEGLGSLSGEKSPAPAPTHAATIAPPPPIPSPQGTTELPLSPNAVTVLERRYLKKDSEGRLVETVEQMFRRVAHAIVEAETRFSPLYDEADVKAWEEAFYQVMTQLDFLPNSPTLMNAGTELGQLSACFVLPIADSLSDIFEAIRHTALIHQSGGGTGFSFSRLRPENDVVRSTGGVASGPVSFMKVFDAATETIKQGGRRRGANMGILNVDHPDILRFITAKEKGDFPNFNISVAVTEAFMKAVEQGQDYDLNSPRTKQPVGKLNAREVFDRMVQMAWRTGDPGIVFLDRINRDNPTPALGAIESTNPCGEQPLLPYESCNLGSLNLDRMVVQASGKAEVDWDKLARVIGVAVRFLDNVIEVNHFPIPEIEAKTRATRKVGLGVMGFADMLIRLGIPYNSEEALSLGERVMKFISDKANEASVAVAHERGVFPTFAGSIYDQPGGLRVRNATRTTIAPTGTLSIIANVSSGIEPLFALSYVRHVLDNDALVEVHPIFEEVAKREGFYSPEMMKALADGKSLQEMEKVPEWAKRIFVTAHDISPEWHVKMQAAFQRYTDNAVSKTVNFPHDAAPEDVDRAFRLAYREGCKGITIYRDQSKEQQVLTTGGVLSLSKDQAAPKEQPVETGKITPRRRPRDTDGKVSKIATGCGSLYVTVARDEQGVCEVFSHLGKAGGCASAQSEACARLISLALRSGVEVEAITDQLQGIRCPSPAWDSGQSVLSCPDAIATVLQRLTALRQAQDTAAKGESPLRQAQGTSKGNGHSPSAEGHSPSTSSGHGPEPPRLSAEGLRNLAGQCPECSSLLVYQEGCLTCRSCGYTRCS